MRNEHELQLPCVRIEWLRRYPLYSNKCTFSIVLREYSICFLWFLWRVCVIPPLILRAIQNNVSTWRLFNNHNLALGFFLKSEWLIFTKWKKRLCTVCSILSIVCHETSMRKNEGIGTRQRCHILYLFVTKFIFYWYCMFLYEFLIFYTIQYWFWASWYKIPWNIFRYRRFPFYITRVNL
jgi:hypothetical protein